MTDEANESIDDVDVESELEALELMYNEKDDNDYCEGFLYEDVNWKLIDEYAREELIDVKILLLKIIQFFLVRQKLFRSYEMFSNRNEFPMELKKVSRTLLYSVISFKPSVKNLSHKTGCKCEQIHVNEEMHA